MSSLTRYYLLLISLLIFIFFLDLKTGSIAVDFSELFRILRGFDGTEMKNLLIWEYRLPKALTALFVGAGIALTGLQMQCLFRNPLADASILGISSGAGLGVALYTMLLSLIPSLSSFVGVSSHVGIVLASCIGSLVVLLILFLVSGNFRDILSVLLLGIMISFFASSLIILLQYFSSDESLKHYLIWSFGSLSSTNWVELKILITSISFVIALACFLAKGMNALSLGDHYARSMGVNIQVLRLLLILITSVIIGVVTAFVGPIAFLGMAVPHLAKLIVKGTDHMKLIPLTLILGALLMLLCDWLSHVSDLLLPINALTSLLLAPIIIFVLLKLKRGQIVY